MAKSIRILLAVAVSILTASSVVAAPAMLVGTGSDVAILGASGAYLGTLLSTGGPGNAAYGIAVGQNGDVYVSSYHTNEIIRWSASTGLVTTIDVSAHVSGPNGLAFGSGDNNYLYVASSNTGEIVKYDPSGNYVGVFAAGIPNVSGLEFCANGNLYVSLVGTPGETSDSTLLKINAAGTSVLDFSTGFEINDPWGLASYDSTLPYIYVASRETNTVLRYIRSSRVLDAGWNLKTADGGAPFTGLSSPAGTLCDEFGSLYVSDWGNDRILKFDCETGQFEGVFAEIENPLYMRLASVPEPSGIVAIITALAGFTGLARRRRTT